MLVLYGDFVEPDARWTTIRRNNLAFAEAVNKAGGKMRGGRPAEGGHTRQLAHDHDGQEQRRGRRVIQAWLANDRGSCE